MQTRVLLTGLALGIALLHPPHTSAQNAEVILKQDGLVVNIAFSPGGKYVAVAVDTGATHFWEVATGKRLTTLPGPKAKPIRLTFADDGKTLIVVTPPQLTTWEVPAGKLVSKRDACTFVCRHGMGQLEDGAVHLWPADNKAAAKSWRRPGAVWRKTGGEGVPFRPILSNDGEQLAVLFDNKLSVLRLDTLTERAAIDLGVLSVEIEAAALSPDNKYLAIGTQRGLHVWDTAGTAIHTWDEG